MKSSPIRSLLVPLLLAVGLQALPSHAAPSTSKGNISVAQVLELIDQAGSDAQATKTVAAYLFGLGETVGFLFSQAPTAAGLPTCQSSFSLDTSAVSRALMAAAPDQTKWSETLATPIIVGDMLARAGCQ